MLTLICKFKTGITLTKVYSCVCMPLIEPTYFIIQNIFFSSYLLLLWRILNGRGLPNCVTELPSLKCLFPASTVETPIHSPMSCVHLFLGLPLPLLPSHVPSKNSFSNVLCLLMWPKYDSFCFLIRFKSCGAFTPSCWRTAFLPVAFHLERSYLFLVGL